jgi:hypothetical protein
MPKSSTWFLYKVHQPNSVEHWLGIYWVLLLPELAELSRIYSLKISPIINSDAAKKRIADIDGYILPHKSISDVD